jgi:hypothetical protein
MISQVFILEVLEANFLEVFISVGLVIEGLLVGFVAIGFDTSHWQGVVPVAAGP